MIKTLIFDIGGVLGRYNWKQSMTDLNLSEDAKEAITNNVMLSGVWNEVDRNIKNDDELEQLLMDAAAGDELHTGSAKELDRRTAMRRLFLARCDAIYAYPHSEDWLKKWHDAGYQILILSNYSRRMFEETTSKFSFFQYVDGMVISYQEGVIKPEPEIYQILLSRYNLNPEECLFIDDLARNLDAAEQFGIHTVQAKKDYQETEQEINRILKLIQDRAKDVDITEVIRNKRRCKADAEQLRTETALVLVKQKECRSVVPLVSIAACVFAFLIAAICFFGPKLAKVDQSVENLQLAMDVLMVISLIAPFCFCAAVVFFCVRYAWPRMPWVFRVNAASVYAIMRGEYVLQMSEELVELYRSKNWLKEEELHLLVDSYEAILNQKYLEYEQLEQEWQAAEDYAHEVKLRKNAKVLQEIDAYYDSAHEGNRRLETFEAVSRASIDQEKIQEETLQEASSAGEEFYMGTSSIGEDIGLDFDQYASTNRDLISDSEFQTSPAWKAEQEEIEQRVIDEELFMEEDRLHDKLMFLESTEHNLAGIIADQTRKHEVITMKYQSAVKTLKAFGAVSATLIALAILESGALFVLKEADSVVPGMSMIANLIDGLLGIVWFLVLLFMLAFLIKTLISAWKGLLVNGLVAFSTLNKKYLDRLDYSDIQVTEKAYPTYKEYERFASAYEKELERNYARVGIDLDEAKEALHRLRKKLNESSN